MAKKPDPAPALVPVKEFAQLPWVVASSDMFHYRRLDLTGIVWTEDPDEALQFFRRADAEAFAAEDEDAWHIVQLDGGPIVRFTPEDDLKGARFAERRKCIALVRAMDYGVPRSPEGRKAIEAFRLALVRAMSEGAK